MLDEMKCGKAMQPSSDSLKVAVIQRFLPGSSRGGVGYFTHGLCNALQKRGHAITVFSHDPRPEDALYSVRRLQGPANSVAIFTFPFQVAFQDFSSFDVIHAQGDDQLIRRNKVPIIRTLHGSSLAEAIHNGWRRHSIKHLLLHLYFYGGELLSNIRSESVVLVSRDTAKYYPGVHEVIPNGVDIEALSNQKTQKSIIPSILFVGDLKSRKRGWFLLKIFRDVVKPQIPDAELWIVSPDAVRGEGVRWFGSINSEELVRLYAEARVFCLPSSYEGFGRPYVEALAAGTIVVTSANPGAKEILEDGRYGLIVPDEELGTALCTVLKDSELQNRFSKLGKERSQLYSWDKVAGQYERVYETALGRNTR